MSYDQLVPGDTRRVRITTITKLLQVSRGLAKNTLSTEVWCTCREDGTRNDHGLSGRVERDFGGMNMREAVGSSSTRLVILPSNVSNRVQERRSLSELLFE